MKSNTNWQPLIELIVVLATIVGSTVPLYIHMDNKLDQSIAKMNENISAIHEEMKDFHGRLCAIEERRGK